MPNITIYTADRCGFCNRARRLLTDKGVMFEEINVTGKPEIRAEMRNLAKGVNTVPQIFIDEIHIGGCDDLFALEHANKLNTLLSRQTCKTNNAQQS